ncbi:MAG TPA: hypothetical protein VGB61_13065, partial [Pyrinomonadaceae bacterium]
MKLKIFIVIVAVLVAWVAGRSIKSGGHSIVRSVQHEAQGESHGDEARQQQQAGTSQSGGSERR